MRRRAVKGMLMVDTSVSQDRKFDRNICRHCACAALWDGNEM